MLDNDYDDDDGCMIVKRIDENAIAVMPEDSDDLLNLRRIIVINDKIAGDTTRVIKPDRDSAHYTRPDKGERIHIRMSMIVQAVSLDGVLDRLRIHGVIAESSHDTVPHGSHHSMSITIGQGITISKNRWLPIQKRLLYRGGGKTGFVFVAIDAGECGLARLKGTHLEFLPNIYSNTGGKRYKTNPRSEGIYLERVRQAIDSILKKDDKAIIFGPGEIKRRLANLKGLVGYNIKLAEGIDSGGQDGIYLFTRSQVMKDMMLDNNLTKAATVIDKVMLLIARGKKGQVTMGFDDTYRANQLGAVETLVFSDKAVQDNDEQKIMDLLNDAEGNGVSVYGVDSTTDVGLRVSKLGGVITTLRYEL